MLWITENNGVICVTTILMCDSMNEERMFEGGNAMEEPMKKLKNIMELNNTLCEAYNYLKENREGAQEIVDSMKYGIEVMDTYDFDLISEEQNIEIRTQNNKLKQSFQIAESDGGLDKILDIFLSWEKTFQNIVFLKIIQIVLNGRESWKDNKEILEDMLVLIINCTIQLPVNFTALEVFAYSRLIAFKRPMEAYQMGLKAFEMFPELGKSFFVDKDSYGFNYVYDKPEEHIFEDCPGCGGKGTPYYTVYPLFAANYDKMFSPVKLWMKCSKCGQLYAYNFPKALVETHPEEEELGDESYMRPKLMHLRIFCDILKKAESFAGGGKTLLEVGPGTGELIATAMEMKFNVEAIEISKRQANRLQNLFRTDIHCMDFLKFETENKYDIVTMGDVIEHVTNPRAALEKAHALLKDSGVLWIATPNFESGFSRILQDNDPMWREPYHISYFSYDILENLLNEVGFEVVDYEVSQRYNGSMELFAKKIDKR